MATLLPQHSKCHLTTPLNLYLKMEVVTIPLVAGITIIIKMPETGMFSISLYKRVIRQFGICSIVLMEVSPVKSID